MESDVFSMGRLESFSFGDMSFILMLKKIGVSLIFIGFACG